MLAGARKQGFLQSCEARKIGLVQRNQARKFRYFLFDSLDRVQQVALLLLQSALELREKVVLQWGNSACS